MMIADETYLRNGSGAKKHFAKTPFLCLKDRQHPTNWAIVLNNM